MKKVILTSAIALLSVLGTLQTSQAGLIVSIDPASDARDLYVTITGEVDFIGGISPLRLYIWEQDDPFLTIHPDNSDIGTPVDLMTYHSGHTAPQVLDGNGAALTQVNAYYWGTQSMFAVTFVESVQLGDVINISYHARPNVASWTDFTPWLDGTLQAQVGLDDAVPEPATIGLMGISSAILFGIRRIYRRCS